MPSPATAGCREGGAGGILTVTDLRSEIVVFEDGDGFFVKNLVKNGNF
jgi:hypothetical protein